MRQRIMLVLMMCFCFQGLSIAQEKVTVQDRIVGGTFKNMARAYIAATDIEKLKDKNIKRIRSMRKDWFEKQYAEVYLVIKDLPPQLREKYRVRPDMTKGQAIAIIRSRDKKQVYEIIDQVPDPMISQQFNAQFTHEDGQAKAGLMDRVRVIWAKVLAAVNKP